MRRRVDMVINTDAYRLETMAAHVNALINHLGADTVHTIGHDWGAAFAIGFAQRYPERVSTVTGLSAPPQSVILKLLENNSAQRKVFAYIKRLKQANPALFIRGDEDPIITPDAIDELQSISDNLTLLPLTGVGHWPHIEETETVNAAIRTLLQKVNHRQSHKR